MTIPMKRTGQIKPDPPWRRRWSGGGCRRRVARLTLHLRELGVELVELGRDGRIVTRLAIGLPTPLHIAGIVLVVMEILRRNRATTGNSTPPTMPPQSTVPNPATPALSLPFVSAPRLPRSVAGAVLRLANRSRRHKRAVGGHMSLRAAAPPDSRAAPATIGCGKRPGLRASRWHSRSLHTIVDCTRRCC